MIYNVPFLLYSKVTQSYKSMDGLGVPVVAQWVSNPNSTHEDESSIPGLAQWVNDLALP